MLYLIINDYENVSYVVSGKIANLEEEHAQWYDKLYQQEVISQVGPKPTFENACDAPSHAAKTLEYNTWCRQYRQALNAMHTNIDERWIKELEARGYIKVEFEEAHCETRGEVV